MITTQSGLRIAQRHDELAEFTALLVGEGVRSYLEVGARHGDTFHHIMSALPVGSRGVAVDLPEAKWGREGSRDYLLAAGHDLSLKGYDIHVIIGDSADRNIVADVADVGPFDAIFIDGDHTYAAVMTDWNTYGPMARIVALHDIDPLGRPEGSPVIAVARVWSDISPGLRSREIIGGKRGMGIGVIWRTP